MNRHHIKLRGAILGLGVFLLAGLSPANADADDRSTQFFQSFHHSSVGLDHQVTRPPSASNQGNTACLTAHGGPSYRVLPQCTTVADADGAGALRLTAGLPNRVGAVFAAHSYPFDQGVDVTFTSYQYATPGSSGKVGSGIAVAVAAADPDTSTATVQIGAGSGSLGYAAAAQPLKPGLSKGYLGVGLDVGGAFSTTATQGDRCGAWPAFRDPQAGQVVVRGPGDGTRGYCLERTSYSLARGPLALRGPDTATPATVNRSHIGVPVEVALNPSAHTVRTASGWEVHPGWYLVVVTPLTGPVVVVEGWLPDVPRSLYPDGWLDHGDKPKRVVIGVSASTSTSTDIHEINNLRMASLTPTTGNNGQPGR